MTQTVLQRVFAPLKAYLPRWIAKPIRSVATALLTPVFFSYRTGHFLSSFKMAAVSKDGKPLPWYCYPCIDFLMCRTYENRTILEFGGGQSTLWWAERAKRVVTIDGGKDWYLDLKDRIPINVDLHYVTEESAPICVAEVERVLKAANYSAFDVIIIDGLYRYEMIAIARRLITPDGMIICDDAHGYGFYEGFREAGLNRVDFVGYAPGVVLPHVTSVFFGPNCFAFDANWAIPTVRI